MKNREVKNIIPACGCDALLPFALMYLFYIILHGHLSPGGGFQGGVLMVAVVVFIYLGHGYETTTKALSWNAMHHGEGWASIFYVLVALLGVAVGAQFCQNVLYNFGNIGDIWSSGTIFLMNVTVGIKVLTGVGVLALSMFGLLALEDRKE